MDWTISLIMVSMCLGVVMEIIGCLEVLTQTMMKHAKRTGVLCWRFFAPACPWTSSQVLSIFPIFIPSRMFRLECRRSGLHPKNLSRCLKDMGTLASPLIPWNTGGAYTRRSESIRSYPVLCVP